ncbi:transcription antitermination factor NusB [Schaalia cardiffensis]|uniref:transcription antitermination factor NusB n=1 Tax=Schaalia cardiffensis TaxID=181487 RepID=UPI0023EFF168|nr:transcription antitermination factor NusB [Schaalia cardiffensis]
MSRAFRFTSRTKARKRAADVVFEADQRGMGRDSEVLRDLLRQRRVITAAETPLPEYSIQIIEGVANNLRRIDDLIAARAKVSGLDRIAAVDLAVMRVAVWEMLENSEDVSPIIAIDEAISIVKSLSTDAAPSFVNAVLDAIRKDLEAPAWTRREASVVEDEPALDSEDEPALDLEDEDGEPTEVHDDAEDAPLSPEFAEPGEEGPTDELSDEELAELDELLDEY